MPNSEKALGTALDRSKITREILEDGAYLGKLVVQHIMDGLRNTVQEETATLTKTIVRALIALPLLMMASLFAGAAAIEWLAENIMLSLTTVYGIGALVFLLLALVVILIPVRRRRPVSVPAPPNSGMTSGVPAID